MTTFTTDDKTQIMSYVLENQEAGNEAVWHELGLRINRNWQEIKDAYFQWKSEEKASCSQSDSEKLLMNDSYQLVTVATVQQHEDYQCFSTSVMEHTHEFYTNMIQSVTSIDKYDRDQLYKIVNSKDYSANSKGSNNQHCKQFELNYIDEIHKDLLEKKTREELQMKREEHKKVMEIYEKHLQYGEELHTECMKLLKTKLQSAKRQLHDVDDVIFKKNLKRFKSGPI